MAITQYQPSTDLFGPLFEDFLRPLSRAGAMPGMLRAPDADVVETEGDLMVVLDAPGMTPDSIDLTLENNILTVSGERRPEWQENADRYTYHLSERRYGKFSRSFVLPRDVDQDGIQARFENGVLTIQVPKSEQARRRRIEIQTVNGNGNGRVSTNRIETGGAGK